MVSPDLIAWREPPWGRGLFPIGPSVMLPAPADAAARLRHGELYLSVAETVLGEEPESRVDGLRAARLGGRDHVLGVQVRIARLGRTDPLRLVAHTRVQRTAVGLGIDRDRAHAHLMERRGDAAGDLASVGDQDLAEHVRSGGSGLGRWRERAGKLGHACELWKYIVAPLVPPPKRRTLLK